MEQVKTNQGNQADCEHQADVEHHGHCSPKVAKNIRSFQWACAFFVVLAVGFGGFLLRGLRQPDCTEGVTALNSNASAALNSNASASVSGLPLVSSSLVDTGAIAPPNPSNETLEDLKLSGNRTVMKLTGANSSRHLQASGIRERVPYIIRSKHPGSWLDAELSWDGRAGLHPRASIQFDDPVAWELRRSGPFYRIHSLYPGAWYNAELSWDQQANWHPMASVEFNDPVDWQFVPKGGAKYRIVSKYQHSWRDAELSWDTRSPHPMVSVEHHDAVDWELIPAYTIKCYWMYDRPLTAAPGSTLQVTVYWGTERTYGWSSSETFARTVSASATVGFEVKGVGSSYTVEESVTREFTSSYSTEFTVSHGQETTTTYAAGEHCTNLWKFVVETTNNHYKNRGQTVLTHTRGVEATGSRQKPPKCMPGYCKFNTECQLCTHERGCIGPCSLSPPTCTPDRWSLYCPAWKRYGYCTTRYVAWMNKYCDHSCNCD